MRCSKDEPLIYDDPSPPQPKASASGPPSLRGVFVDHCRYLGVYIGVRLEHPGVWLRRPLLQRELTRACSGMNKSGTYDSQLTCLRCMSCEGVEGHCA